MDPNSPIEVKLRLGKPSVNSQAPTLSLPIVYAPVLKTSWHVAADEGRILVPLRGTVEPATPVLPPSGLVWLARRGLVPLLSIGALIGIGLWGTRRRGVLFVGGLVCLAIAIGLAFSTADAAQSSVESPAPLQLSLPVISPGDLVELSVSNWPAWRSQLSFAGIALILVGLSSAVWSMLQNKLPKSENGGAETSDRTATEEGSSEPNSTDPDSAKVTTEQPGPNKTPADEVDLSQYKPVAQVLGILLVFLGILLQRQGAGWFFGLLGITALILFIEPAWRAIRGIQSWLVEMEEKRRQKNEAAAAARAAAAAAETAAETDPGAGAGGGVVTTVLLIGLLLSWFGDPAQAAVPEGFQAANSISQQWKVSHKESRLTATGSIELTGKPGDPFLAIKGTGNPNSI